MAETRREFMKTVGATVAAGALAAGGAVGEPRAKRPNFIVFLTDDQGYGDLSCVGSDTVITPNLDAVAASGVRFTQWYSNSPVCSPSRAALMTGRYPGNAGVRSILGGHRTAPGLPGEVPTLATALRDQGYRTAVFGKWHLGLQDDNRPEAHGFDESFGFYAGCVDYFSHIFYWSGNHDPLHDLWENGKEVYANGRYLTELIAERAVDYLRRSRDDQRPFFLYVPFNAPHYPMHAPQAYLDRFPDLPWDRRIMAAMIAAVDDAVGTITAELRAQNLLDDTCIFFSSDNGPSRETRNWLDGRTDPYYGGSAGKLKGHKFSLFEGGVRMPALMSWPKRIPSQRVVDGVGAHMDVFPTLLRAAGGDPSAYALDGEDVMPWVAGEAEPTERTVFWEQQGQTAVRRGPWKLVLNGELVEGEPAPDTVHLANVVEDMGERENRASNEVKVTEELKAAAESWRAGIEARWRDEWKPKRDAKSRA
ncbi:MAG: sulfatase-like hydrolase/transferase [FCB group bacterium]|jgi:arylsulfatase A-like enzyme|nr:sulfatase-like hydrolase/transferase [FCB group bacterium]